MSLKINKYFGLNVNKSLNEIADKSESVKNLGLDIKDLETINGIASLGTTRTDMQSVSGLSTYAQRKVTSLENEVSQYKKILDDAADFDSKIKGNLDITGSVGGTSIKFKFLDDTDDISFADISTSRASSWSSSGTLLTDPQFYGGTVEVVGTVNANSFGITQDAAPVLFPDSEKPTHKIQATINGNLVFLYAMKNIPLEFAGFFRNISAEVELIEQGYTSWRVVDINNAALTTKYENQNGLSNKSTLTENNTSFKERLLEIYQNPDNIKKLSLPGAGIKELPQASLPQLTDLDLSNNILIDFSDFNSFSPALEYLNLFNNNFTNSNDADARQFNSVILSRIPTSIKTLILGKTFNSEINTTGTADLTALTNLINVDFSSDRGNLTFFKSLPEVSTTVESYNMSGNRFDSIPQSVKELPNLKLFIINANLISDDSFELLFADNIETVDISRNNINVPDLSNRNFLESFNAQVVSTNDFSTTKKYGLVSSSDGSGYKFQNCNSLTSLNFNNSGYTGPIPKFVGNTSLNRFEAINSNLAGGVSDDGTDDYIFYEDHFDDCAETLSRIRIRSSQLLNKPIHPDAFLKTVNLSFLQIVSNKRGVTGQIPQIFKLKKLTHLILYNNNLSGPLPGSLIFNPSISYIHLYNNDLSGRIPVYESSSLRFLYLHRNQLTSFDGLLCNNLRRLFLSFNQLSGNIPDMSNLESLIDCYLNNNQLDGYTTGSFSTLTRLRRLDISINNLTEDSVNRIIDDLYQNYIAAPRQGVIINLTGNAALTGESVKKAEFLQNSGWSIIV